MCAYVAVLSPLFVKSLPFCHQLPEEDVREREMVEKKVGSLEKTALNECPGTLYNCWIDLSKFNSSGFNLRISHKWEHFEHNTDACLRR